MRVLVAIIFLTCVGCATDNTLPLDSDLYGNWTNTRKYWHNFQFSSHGKFLLDTGFPDGENGFKNDHGDYYVVGSNIVFQISESNFRSDNSFTAVANYSIQNDTLILSGHWNFYDGKFVKSNIKSKETIQPLH